MTFTLSRATPQDIPSMIEVWCSAFNHPNDTEIFPDTPAVHAWMSDVYARSMSEEKQHTIFMVITEEQLDGKRKVVSWSKWVAEKDGVLSDWRLRWGNEFAEGMVEEKLDAFFSAMAQQHLATMGDRKHYFLEVLVTHSDYERNGLGSKLLEWGCAAADAEGLESYLDASETGKPLYEKFGYVYQAEKKKSRSAPMLRPAKKVE